MSPGGPARKGSITLLALAAAMVLIAVIYVMRMPSGATPAAQPSPHAIDQGG